MKKLITAALALSMTVSAFAPCAFADDGLDKVISEVKTRAGVTDEYDDFSSDYTAETDDYTEYRFEWRAKDENKSVNVNYNTDDVITYYHYYQEKDFDDSLSLPKVSSQEAKEAAQEFLDKLNPSFKGEYVISENDRSGSGALTGDYSFRIDRMKNGVPINDFYGGVDVDRETAEVYSVHMSYIPVDKFEDVSNTISAEDAKAAFKEKLGLELVYNYYYDDRKIVVFPVYKEATDNKYISAVTGEVYEPELGVELYRATAENAMADMNVASSKYEAGGGLSQVEIDELEKIDGLISKADIEAQVRNNKTLKLKKDLKLDSINLQRDYYDDTQYTYSMYFSGEKNSARVSADAKTGEIKSFYSYEENEETEEKEPKEDKVKNSAEKIMNELAGSKKSEYRFDKVFGDTALYTRYVNDIKVIGDTISISVDNSGKLTSYDVRYVANAEFPSLDGAISADEAADKLFEAVNYDVKYFLASEEEKTEAKALYMLDETGYINPFSGALVNYRNQEITGKVEYSYSDIADHYAKNQIETLASYGVGFEGGEYKPNEKITQRDFLYLLLKASYSYNDFLDDDELYRVAESQNLIDERDENAEITRAEMAKLIIRFIDAEEFAQYDDIYVTPFNDVTENKGYVAILSAMGVVQGDENGNFNPDANMTRAEAACVIYNYLNR